MIKLFFSEEDRLSISLSTYFKTRTDYLVLDDLDESVNFIVQHSNTEMLPRFSGRYALLAYGQEEFGAEKIKDINNNAKYLIVPSPFHQKYYYDLGVDSNKIVIASWGVDTDYFIPDVNKQELDKILLRIVGGLVDGMGETLAAITGKYPFFNWTLYDYDSETTPDADALDALQSSTMVLNTNCYDNGRFGIMALSTGKPVIACQESSWSQFTNRNFGVTVSGKIVDGRHTIDVQDLGTQLDIVCKQFKTNVYPLVGMTGLAMQEARGRYNWVQDSCIKFSKIFKGYA